MPEPRADRFFRDGRGLLQDGRYAFQFTADGYVGGGILAVRGSNAVGQGHRLRLSGDFAPTTGALQAEFRFDLRPDTLNNRMIADAFVVSMIGTATGDRFTLFGLGPLGVIVEVVAARIDVAPDLAIGDVSATA